MSDPRTDDISAPQAWLPPESPLAMPVQDLQHEPVTTERDTYRIRVGNFRNPAAICSTPVSSVATSRYCRPWSFTRPTINSAIAPVAAEIMPGRPPAKAITTAMQKDA